MNRTMCALAMLLLSAGASAAEPFTLTSTAFADGGLLERSYAGDDKANAGCTGSNVSPALAWANVPSAAKSLALLIYDQQGRNGLGVNHQVAYGIPVSASGFERGQLAAGSGFVGGKGSAGRTVYYGPCPPAGSGLHHYVFTLIATDLDPVVLEPGLTREQLLDELAGHALGSAAIVARFGQ